jgi:peptidoglycan/xylan/chitin deacetylase (PgdA/CDA1 family)
MNKVTKDIVGMHARLIIKLLIKLNLAALASFKKSIQRDNKINNVYILMYHRVNDYRKNEMSVPVREFRKQVAWLKKRGIQSMRMAELESTAPVVDLKTPRVIFTFDDGYEDNYSEALPILKEFGYTAIFYIPYECIGKVDMFPRDIRESNCLEHNRIMDWEQVIRIHREGMEIGSHTLSHNDLKKMSDQKAKREIFESKKMIEEKLGSKISSFCYPGGHFNDKHINWVEEAGYFSACTTKNGFYQNESLFRIPRIAVLASDRFFIFKQKILGDMKLLGLIH